MSQGEPSESPATRKKPDRTHKVGSKGLLIATYARLNGNSAAAREFGVSLATVKRQVQKFQDSSRDEAERIKFDTMRKWAEQLPDALGDAVTFLRRATRHLDPAKQADVRAITDALRVMAELVQAERLIDARLTGETGEAGTENPAVSATSPASGDSPARPNVLAFGRKAGAAAT